MNPVCEFAGLCAAVRIYTEILSGRKTICKTRLALAAYDGRDCLAEISQYRDGLVLLRREIAEHFVASGRSVKRVNVYRDDASEVLSRLHSAGASETLILARKRWYRNAGLTNAQRMQERIGSV